MTGPEFLDVARDGIYTYARAAGPLMAVTLIVGLIISFVQAITQIQEQTLLFVPKMALSLVALLFLMPFMGDALGSYMTRVATRIALGG